MRIGIKTITGIGLATLLSLGVAIPAHADGNNSGDSFANATDNSKTITLTNSDPVNFKYTNIGTETVDFTWNAAAFGTAADPVTWCEIRLWAKKPFMAGYYNGYGTVDGNVSSYHFGPTDNGDGGQDVTVTPGATFRVELLCHNTTDLLKYSYLSNWFTAVEVPTETPTKPFVKLYNGTDVLAALTGGFPNGEAWADHCIFRLYKNGTRIKSATDACNGGITHTFMDLDAGTYQVDTATINSAGQSGWSILSNKITVKAGARNTAVNTTIAKAPTTVNPTFSINGNKVHVTWSKAKANKGTAIKQYKVVITKGKATKYRHTFTATKRAFTKTLPHGVYQVKITATNRSGKATTTNVKLKF